MLAAADNLVPVVQAEQVQTLVVVPSSAHLAHPEAVKVASLQSFPAASVTVPAVFPAPPAAGVQVFPSAEQVASAGQSAPLS